MEDGCNIWLEHTEECVEDWSNIQRNVWRMGGTYRGMYGGLVEHTEECMEDGWNIQRNVWRMGGTYRGMYGGWEEHTEEGWNVQRMGGR